MAIPLSNKTVPFCLHVRVKQSSLLHSRPKSTVGTPAYIAPEVLSRREYDGKVSPASIPLSPSSLFLRVLLSISKGPRGDADDDSLQRVHTGESSVKMILSQTTSTRLRGAPVVVGAELCLEFLGDRTW